MKLTNDTIHILRVEIVPLILYLVAFYFTQSHWDDLIIEDSVLYDYGWATFVMLFSIFIPWFILLFSFFTIYHDLSPDTTKYKSDYDRERNSRFNSIGKWNIIIFCILAAFSIFYIVFAVVTKVYVYTAIFYTLATLIYIYDTVIEQIIK